MDIRNCYFHSLNLNGEKTLEVLEDIIRDGKILSLERSGKSYDHVRMNKSDEICISKMCNQKLFYNSAFNMYVKQKVSFILKGNLPNVYKPDLIPVSSTFGDELSFCNSGFTDMYDEFRVKDEIPLDYVVGINVPFKSIMDNLGSYKWFFLDCDESFRGKMNDSKNVRVERVISFYRDMKTILDENGIYLPIFDIEAGHEIKSESDLIKIKKKR